MTDAQPYAKPLPVPSRVTEPFWEGLRQGELRLQRCADCGKHIFYPRSVCKHCLSQGLEWVIVSGRGRLYSYTVVRRAMNPAFQSDVPYVYAIVELEEGPRVTTNVVNCALDALWVDMPLKAVYDSVTPEVTLLKFEPA
jgi:uncharacterized OB-fold protein